MEHAECNESDDPNLSLEWSVNLLCIVGASIGVASLFFGWIYEPPTMPTTLGIRNYPTILYMVVAQYLHYEAATLFLLGTMIAFVSPIGGIPQWAGLALFSIGIIESGHDPVLDGIDPQQKIWFGMALGVASSVLVLLSMFLPWGTGKLRFPRSGGIRLVERLLTVTLSMRH